MMMKRLICGAAILSVISSSAICASADDMMVIRMTGERDAVTVEELASQDAVVHGELKIENYKDFSYLRTILRSDDPLSIENGGFVYTDDTHSELALFGGYDTAIYTQYSEITGKKNYALYYAKDCAFGKMAEVVDPDSALVSFDIRVPQGTAAGDYTLFISQEQRVNSVGQREDDFFCTADMEDLIVGEDLVLEPLVFSVFSYGDVNLDGQVSAIDAQHVLSYYLETEVAQNVLTEEDFCKLMETTAPKATLHAMDVNLDDARNSLDAQDILAYYLDSVVGNQPSWKQPAL
ncbi:MAG: dockerin type I domain-containing protein [Oscillospiraceae bacterium]|nr:dockerin type I domain-containing protein [Oscillospiraceae bacterium]